MNYIVDIVLVAIILVFAIVGWNKGIVRIITGFASSLISMIAAIILYKPFAAFMEKTPIYTGLRENILSKLIVQQGSMLDRGAQFRDGAKAMITESLGLPKFLSDFIAGQIPNPAEVVTTRQIAETISTHIAKVAISIISLVLIIIIARVGLYFAKGILSVLTKLPVIHQADGFLGLIAGIFQGFLIIFVLMTLLVLLGTLPEFKSLLDIIDKTYITKAIYNYNPITSWMFPKGGAI